MATTYYYTLASAYGVRSGAKTHAIRIGIRAAALAARETWVARCAAAGLTEAQAALLSHEEFPRSEVWVPPGAKGVLDVDEDGSSGRILSNVNGVIYSSDPAKSEGYIRVTQDMGGLGSLSLFHFGYSGSPCWAVGLQRLKLSAAEQLNSPNNAQNHIIKCTAQSTLQDTVGVLLEDLELVDPATACMWFGADSPYWVKNVTARRIRMTGGGQNHVTFQRGLDGFTFEDVVSKDPTDQSFDFEISEQTDHHAQNVTLRNVRCSKFGNADSTIFGISGEGTAFVKTLRVYDSTFYGVTRLIRSVRDVEFHRCKFLASDVSSIRGKIQIERDCYDVLFKDCIAERAAVEGVNPVVVMSQISSLWPTRITFRGCQLTQYANDTILFAEMCEDLVIEPSTDDDGNVTSPSRLEFKGTANDTEYGVWMRAVGADLSLTITDTVIAGNTATSGRLRARVAIFPHTVGNVDEVNISGVENHLDANGSPTALYDIMAGSGRADYNAYPMMAGVDPARCDWNSSSTPVPIIISGDRDGVLALAFRGASPESVVVAPVGSVVYRVDTNEVLYKDTGISTTGWVTNSKD